MAASVEDLCKPHPGDDEVPEESPRGIARETESCGCYVLEVKGWAEAHC